MKGERMDTCPPDTYANRVAREALRDQFAAAALTGLLAGRRNDGYLYDNSTDGEFRSHAVAVHIALAYEFADAALARRAQTADAPAPASTAP